MTIDHIYQPKKRFSKALDLRFPAIILLVLVLASAGLQASSLAYMETLLGQFGTIDLGTGVFSLIGTITVPLGGLGVAGGMLYGLGSSGTLYQINTATGVLSTVGNSSHNYNVFGSTLNGLYAIDTSTELYSIDPATGAATLVGPTGLGLAFNGLSTNASTLYWADGHTLYTLSTTTGAATEVGSIGGIILGAMVEENGILYGGEFSPSSAVVTVNATTGAITPGPSVSGASEIAGLAPDPLPSTGPVSAPEPQTWTLLGAGMVGLGLIRSRMKRAKS